MKTILAIVCLFALCSCSTVKPVGCAVEQSAESAISAAVATSLSCTNLSAIQTDITAAIGKLNLCTVNDAACQVKHHLKGPVGDVVCPLAVSGAMGLLANAIPQAWGCSPSASLSGLASVLTKACTSVVPL